MANTNVPDNEQIRIPINRGVLSQVKQIQAQEDVPLWRVIDRLLRDGLNNNQ